MSNSLDAAYEREAILAGLVKDPTFPENKKYVNPSEIEVWHSVIKDMVLRNEFGKEKYGKPLRPFNGRKGLQDAYEEALDLAVYLKQLLLEEKYGRN